MMKRSLVLAVAFVLGTAASTHAANPFSDLPAGHWAYDEVMKLVEDDVIVGYPNATFGGNKILTRYEMAMVIARAIAKGANVDKLAAEFADELDALGVRVANLEKSADEVKITGEIRYHYADFDIKNNINQEGAASFGNFNQNQLRSRIWVQGKINDDWQYAGMLENIQDFDNETGDEDVDFQRAYLEGRLGGTDVRAGRYNAFLVNGNLYDTRADGIEASYGKDTKITAFYMKPTDQDGTYYRLGTLDYNWGYGVNYDKAYGVKVDTTIGTVKATAGYTVFKDGYDYDWDSQIGIDQIFDKQDDNKIWNVGFNTQVAKDLIWTVDYLKSDMDKVTNGTDDALKFDGDDGIVVGLNYKGAMANKPGSYGIYANYYDQSRGTVIAHTMNGFYGCTGFEGYMVGVNYTFAKNIVGSVEWYDLESKALLNIYGDNIAKEDMETLWAQVVFTF